MGRPAQEPVTGRVLESVTGRAPAWAPGRAQDRAQSLAPARAQARALPRVQVRVPPPGADQAQRSSQEQPAPKRARAQAPAMPRDPLPLLRRRSEARPPRRSRRAEPRYRRQLRRRRARRRRRGAGALRGALGGGPPAGSAKHPALRTCHDIDLCRQVAKAADPPVASLDTMRRAWTLRTSGDKVGPTRLDHRRGAAGRSESSARARAWSATNGHKGASSRDRRESGPSSPHDAHRGAGIAGPRKVSADG